MTESQSRAQELRAHSPEYDFVQEALRGLRADLLDREAFAYRPLRPRKVRFPLVPAVVQPWVPHLTVLVLALITLGVGAGSDSVGGSLSALVPTVAVLLTLVRPTAAFWLSLLSAPLVAWFGGLDDGWPWPDGAFAGHLVVLSVVALRTRPRTAAWMYGLSVLYSGAATVFHPGAAYSTDALPFLFFAAVSLLVITVREVRRAARHELTEERMVTAVERSRRTLLEERSTIARELHDVVAHHMSVVAIQAEAAPYRVQDPPPELERAFTVIRENAVAALAELRRVLGVVRAEDYEAPDAPQPCLADLDVLVENVREAGMKVGKAVTGAVRELPQGVELSAYRIVQEALSNTLRHAPGAAAEVELAYVLGGFGLRIVNGPAEEPVLPSPGAGHGVTGMRERVAMLDGEMTAGPTADGGYEVAVFLPLPRAEETADTPPGPVEDAAPGIPGRPGDSGATAGEGPRGKGRL
ncbi:sensor histidine kinase [Streptomyces sp. NPDC050560]|uniref:sensor histidine kinase n=1 Tax=Streptomyces sp. NPDC050560 TaxID=3365630 RepID=UPI00379AFBDB